MHERNSCQDPPPGPYLVVRGVARSKLAELQNLGLPVRFGEHQGLTEDSVNLSVCLTPTKVTKRFHQLLIGAASWEIDILLRLSQQSSLESALVDDPVHPSERRSWTGVLDRSVIDQLCQTPVDDSLTFARAIFDNRTEQTPLRNLDTLDGVAFTICPNSIHAFIIWQAREAALLRELMLAEMNDIAHGRQITSPIWTTTCAGPDRTVILNAAPMSEVRIALQKALNT